MNSTLSVVVPGGEDVLLGTVNNKEDNPQKRSLQKQDATVRQPTKKLRIESLDVQEKDERIKNNNSQPGLSKKKRKPIEFLTGKALEDAKRNATEQVNELSYYHVIPCSDPSVCTKKCCENPSIIVEEIALGCRMRCQCCNCYFVTND